MTAIANLKRIPLFDGLGAQHLKALAARCAQVSVRARQYLFREGEGGHTLYVILGGHVKIESVDRSTGRRNTLAILARGDCFGEIAVVTEIHRTAAARALDDTRLLVIEEHQFLELISEYPVIAKNIMKSMAMKLYEANRLIQGLVFRNLQARLAGKILELMEKFGENDGNGTRIALKLSHFDLAELVGTNRETITRILKEFKDEGSVALTRGSITVRDAAALRQWIN
jgi:CRP/FNR family transcriptional regulator, cyclic AMP receptor protein